MKFLLTAFAAGMLLLQVSCNQSANSKSEEVQLQEVQLTDISASDDKTSIATGETYTQDTTFIPEPANQKPQLAGAAKPVDKSEWNKKIIKNGVLNLEVKDYKSFNRKLREKITAVGGFIAAEEQHNSEYKTEEVLTIRVPVEHFDEAVMLITEDVNKIVEKRVTSEDVTASLFDTRSRMEAKKQVRQRYVDLLKQANKMTDILEVEKEINSIQEEIEAASGRINYLSHASAYSTIHLTFFQVINSSVQPDGDPSFFSEVKDAFKTGAHWSGEIFIALLSVWPLWLLVFFIWAAVKKLKISKVKSV